MNSVNHQIRLAARPSGLPETSDGEITTEPVPAPGPGEFVVAISYLCIDPVMGRLIDAAYREPVAIDTVMEVGAVGCGTASELRGDRLLAATGQRRGHPRPRPDRGAERHDPVLPELLWDLRHGTDGALHADHGHPVARQAAGRADGERAQMSRIARDCRS